MNKSIPNYRKFLFFLLLGGVLALASCKKDRLPAIDPIPVATTGVYVLCEGSFGISNNSSITYYDVAKNTTVQDYFKQQNGVSLGTDASDLKQYGSKMYCVVTGAETTNKDSYIEVINIATGKSIKRIPFFDDKNDFMPRYIAFYKNKAYVSGYDGYVSKIDTASLNVESRIAVGGALEGVAIVNGKLYVTNSSHINHPNPNNASVSVVDLNTFTKKLDIPVGFNPTKIAATANGDLFTLILGKYGDDVLKPALDRLSSVTDKKVGSTNASLFSFAIADTKGYAILQGNYPEPNELKVLNVTNGAIGADFITDGTAVTNFYGVTINTLNSDVYVGDADNYGTSGKFFSFGTDGKKKFEFVTGGYPQSAVFNYSYK